MDHQPFETWLVSKETLTPDQRAALQDHLQDCASCQQVESTWGHVESFLSSKPFEHPTAGFTNRWLVRLESSRQQQKAQQERKETWTFLAVTISVAVIIMAFMAFRILSSYESATQVLISGVALITSLVALVTVFQDLALTIIKVAPIVVPPMWLLVIASALGLLCLAWVESLRRLIFSRRVVE